MRPINVEDLVKLTFVSDPQIDPHGSKVAFVVTKMNLDEDEYVNRIWIADLASSEVYSLTNGPKDTNPRWSSSGRYLAFTSRRTLKKEERGSELWIVRLDGGEPRLLIKRKTVISRIEWFPDEKKLAVLLDVGVLQEDVKVIDRLLFWYNGRGFINTLRRHLFIVDVISGELNQITEGEFDVNYFKVSHKGDKIAYIAKLDDSKPYVTDIFIYDLKSGEKVKLTESNMNIDSLSWSPDDRKLVFRGHNFRRGTISHRHIYTIDIDSCEISDLTRDLDRNTVNSLNSDVRGPGRENGPIWIGNYVYFIIHDSGCVNLHRINMLNGEIESITSGERSVECFSVALKDGDHVIAFTSMNELMPPELYVIKDGLKEFKLTSFNDS
ncbi:MAG TPA: S9 family peptidase, partial [Candidatus Atribacteria bacterium]|nr:S9 family peptidase [Candidatus Atribacteria bacterium]